MGSPISIKEIAFIAKINQSNKQKNPKGKNRKQNFPEKEIQWLHE